MTSYFKDNYSHMVIFNVQKVSIKKRVLNFLAVERNSNILNGVAGIFGIIGGAWFLLGMVI